MTLLHKRTSYRSDADLIAAHLSGDTSAWEALLDRYERLIFRLVLRTGASGPDADDIYQNVCLKLYLHLDDLRHIEKLTGWLGAIVRQEAGRHATKNAGPAGRPPLQDIDEIIELPARDPLPEQALQAEEQTRLIASALQQMPAPCGPLLSLLYAPEPTPYAEVAVRLGIPLGSIGPRRARCLERLKIILEELGF